MPLIVQAPERLSWFQSQKGVTLSAQQVVFMDLIQPWVEQACWMVIGYPLYQASYTEFYPSAGSERPPLTYGIDIGWDMVGGLAMPRSRTDLYEGGIHLRCLPVRSVESVYENIAAWTGGDADGTWPVTSLLPPAAYRLDKQAPGLSKSGRLYRTVGGWPSPPRCVKVTYTAGYTQAEIDAEHGQAKYAVLSGLSWWLGRANRQSQGTKTLGLTATQTSIRDFSVTLGLLQGKPPGDWADMILGPDSLMALQQYINMFRFLGN